MSRRWNRSRSWSCITCTFHIRHFCWLTNHFVQSMPGHEASITRMLNQANAILSRAATLHRAIRTDVSKECLQSRKLRIESIVRETATAIRRTIWRRQNVISSWPNSRDIAPDVLPQLLANLFN